MDSTGKFVITLLIVAILGYVLVKVIKIIEWKIKKEENNLVNDDDIVDEILDREFWRDKE